MPTECNPVSMRFARLKGRDVVADFGGGTMTSDAGALLLGATDRAIGLVERFAGCFSDGRSADRVVHDVAVLVGQRVPDPGPKGRNRTRPTTTRTQTQNRPRLRRQPRPCARTQTTPP